MEKRKEEIMKFVFLLAACASIATVAMICLFLFANGLPTIGKIGAADFFLGERWRPANDVYGILPMILGSLYVTLGAIVVGVPELVVAAVVEQGSFGSTSAGPIVYKVFEEWFREEGLIPSQAVK